MSRTISLIDLFGKKFNIPHYQRGYRWEQQEAEELLDDLWDFEKNSNKGEFYCLQPIVLQKNKAKNEYNVLDGQQRLTTLYLILTFLEEMRIDSGYGQVLFTLNYETRTDCHDFLEKKKFVNGIDETNSDYFHITQAYQAIKAWFADSRHAGAKMKLVPVLMDSNDKGNRNVRFIWYEDETAINPIDIFIRLNVGKIPLTDAELTKALLLQSDKYYDDELKFNKMRLFEIASEWDRIEYVLQEDAFWYFLTNRDNDKPTHIELVFDLMADRIQKTKKYFKKKPLKHPTFLILSAYLQDLIENEKKPRIAAVELVWQQVTEYFEYFLDWFKDRTLFHYIGFLLTKNYSIDQLISKAKGMSKKEFIRYLESEIGRVILLCKKRKDTAGKEYNILVEDLTYPNEEQQSDDRAEIHDLLLLHNVYASLHSDKENMRFPFDLYKETKEKKKWSLEHIQAQNSEYIYKPEGQKKWLADHIKSLTSQNNRDFEELISRMEVLAQADEVDKEAFEALVDDVYAVIGKISTAGAQNLHSLANLCLIDSHTNSQLNNSVFDVKREIIKNREREGHYIPVCTRNVFMKGYTEYPASNAYWTAEDRKGYVDSIIKMYTYFTNLIIN